MNKLPGIALALMTSLWMTPVFAAAQNAGQSRAKREFKLTVLDPKFSELIASGTSLKTMGTDFGFTEGPVWDTKGFLYVSDEDKNILYRLYPDGHRDEVLALGDPDGNTYDQHHGLIVTASVLRAIIRVNPEAKTYEVLADKYEGKRLNSPNDIVLGPDGALYFTDPTLDLVKGEKQELAFQGVFRLDTKGKLTLLTKDMTQPNGLAFSPDGKYLYIDDDGSDQRNIRRYQFNKNDGTVSNGMIFADMKSNNPGVPDGMKLDTKGNLYVSGPLGIWIWSPDGKHLGTVELPESSANLAWGGADYSQLFITASHSVFILQTKAKGYVPYAMKK
jgi:gluconolactonase